MRSAPTSCGLLVQDRKPGFDARRNEQRLTVRTCAPAVAARIAVPIRDHRRHDDPGDRRGLDAGPRRTARGAAPELIRGLTPAASRCASPRADRRRRRARVRVWVLPVSIARSIAQPSMSRDGLRIRAQARCRSRSPRASAPVWVEAAGEPSPPAASRTRRPVDVRSVAQESLRHLRATPSGLNRVDRDSPSAGEQRGGHRLAVDGAAAPDDSADDVAAVRSCSGKSPAD